MTKKKTNPTPQEIAVEAAKEAVNKVYEKIEQAGNDPGDVGMYKIEDIVARARAERTLWGAREAKRTANKKGE